MARAIVFGSALGRKVEFNMLAICSSRILVGLLFAAILGLGCSSSKSDSPRDGGTGDTENLDSPRDSGAGVTVTLNITDISATYANKTINLALFAGEVSCESNAAPPKYMDGYLVAADACLVSQGRSHGIHQFLLPIELE
jgi:hypothetical protein